MHFTLLNFSCEDDTSAIDRQHVNYFILKHRFVQKIDWYIVFTVEVVGRSWPKSVVT